MRLNQVRARIYPASNLRALLLVLGGALTLSSVCEFGVAAEYPAANARVKLDWLMVCQQAEKDAAQSDRNSTLDNISKIEALLHSLASDPKYAPTRERAVQALTLANAALRKIDARLALADRKIAMTTSALKYLAPDNGGVAKAPQADNDRRHALNRQADAARFSREVDEDYANEYGFVTKSDQLKNLTNLVNRLQVSSQRADVPFEVKILANDQGPTAAATSTTIYFNKAYLDTNPSESELLFVAGHELAHVQLGHFAETLLGVRDETNRLIYERNQEVTEALGDRTVEALVKMRTGSWEQRQEEAADILGAQQALDAGASPQGIREAILRMDAAEKAWTAGVAPDIRHFQDSLRDHPKPLARLKALETVFGERFWERAGMTSGRVCGK